MIKNIIFDLGNVILKGKPSDILSELKLNSDECEIIKKTFFSNWENLDLGNETMQEHYLKAKIPILLNEEIKEKIINYYKYRPFNDEIIELIKILKNNKYNIYILSNNNIDAYNYLVIFPIFKIVDGWIVSCDYHIIKPNKRIYEILFEKYNLNPKECFFVDDKIDNIEAGKCFGMNGYVFDFEKDGIVGLIDELSKNNIITND